MHFLVLIFIGTCFGLEKRQSEHPIWEHLIPPLLTAETPQWKIAEEELPASPEQRKLRWLEDEARFADFPLGTIREIERNAPAAVVVPAAKDTPLQVARNGPHVFVTNDEVIDSPLKFVSHHHPSLRTVDLSELADELNLIFAHPHHHPAMVLPENNGFQEGWERSAATVKKHLKAVKVPPKQEGEVQKWQDHSAQFDLPEGLNASGNPFESTVLVLPDENPVKKYLKGLQDKMKTKQEQNQGNQTVETQTEQQVNVTQEEVNSGERSATFSKNQGVFVPLGNNQGVFVPIQQQFVQPTASFINNQPGQAQFSSLHNTFVDEPFFRDSQKDNPEQVSNFQEWQERSAQFDLPEGLNASANPFQSTVLVLPDDNPVITYLRGLKDRIKTMQEQNQGNQTAETQTHQQVNETEEKGNPQERSATLHGHQGLFLPTHQQFLQPAATFVNHQPVQVHPLSPSFAQFPQHHTTFVNQPFFRDSKQDSSEEARAAEPTHLHKHKHLHRKFGPEVYPQVHQQPYAQSYQNPGYQRVAAPFLFDIPSRRERFRRERAKRSPTFSRPGSVIFQQQRPSLLNPPFIVPQSSGFGQQSAFQQFPGFAVVPTNSFFRSGQAVKEPDPFLGSEINSEIPEDFPKPDGNFSFNSNDSSDDLPLVHPAENPNATEYRQQFLFRFYKILAETFKEKINTSRIPDEFPPFVLPCAIPIVQAISPDGAPLTKPSDDPFYVCLNKTKVQFNYTHHNIKECNDYKTRICPLSMPYIVKNKTTPTTEDEIEGYEKDYEEDYEEYCLEDSPEDCLKEMHFFDFDEGASKARSAQIDLQKIIGPLSIFEFTNHDNGDEISVVDLDQVFPGDMRAAEADPSLHHHHGSHFFLHQHGFIPHQQCPNAVIPPTQHTGGHIPYFPAKINADLSFAHPLSPSQIQNVQISGKGNGISQSQGQNVYINGDGNSVSQSQSQTASVSNQNSHIHGTGNSVALSQNSPRIRRSLVELVNDPNVKLDVPKTISNIGTVTKTSFHDQKKPMYHLNNMVGSIKDVIMSTIKIPPQGLIIPSQYRIVNAVELDDNNLQAKHEITRSINEDLLPDGTEVHYFNQAQSGDPITDTFSKFGSALRQSIQAGQQTLAHVGDIAHSARQVVHTAKSAAPQMFLPRNQRIPDKVMLVTPKLLEVKNDQEAGQHLLQAQNTRDFVKIGDLMDALSVSNPKEENLGVEKIVIERKSGKRKPVIVGRSRDVEESSLKEFISKMNNQFDSSLKEKLKQEREARRLQKTIKKLERKSDIIKAPLVKLVKQPSKFDSVLGKVQDHVEIMKSKSDQVIDTIQDVNGKFMDTIRTLGGSKATPNDNVVGVTHIILPKNFLTTPKPTAKLKSAHDESEDWDKQVSSFLTELFEEKPPEGVEEVVGAPQFSQNGLNLSADLMKPFMGRASKASLRQFLKQHGNTVEEEGDNEVVGSSNVDEKEMEKIKQAQKVLGAVNPLMFEKLFNETMRGSDEKSLSPYEVFSAGRNFTEEMQVCQDPTKARTSMKITRELLKPFMGRLKGDGYMKVIPVQNDDGGEEERQGYYMEY